MAPGGRRRVIFGPEGWYLFGHGTDEVAHHTAPVDAVWWAPSGEWLYWLESSALWHAPLPETETDATVQASVVEAGWGEGASFDLAWRTDRPIP